MPSNDNSPDPRRAAVIAAARAACLASAIGQSLLATNATGPNRVRAMARHDDARRQADAAYRAASAVHGIDL